MSPRPRRRRSSGKLISLESLSLDPSGGTEIAERVRRVRPITRPQALARLSDEDREMLGVLVEHRVVTTQQMHTLTGIPERTVRYRLNRLWLNGLAGGVQPYRAKGSAPYHWYPSRAADAFVRGKPLPRGGEREDPSEQFMEHAGAITGLYVALWRLAPTLGWEIVRFDREAEGREEFCTGDRPSAVVPDVALVIRAGEAEYHAMVEVDLGTMSMPRVAKKLGLYCSWARSEVWREIHPYLPVVLFLTTTPKRVERILTKFEDKCRWEARRAERFEDGDRLQGFAFGVCELARRPEAALTEARWSGRGSACGLQMVDLLDRPWRTWRDAEAAARERAETEAADREELARDDQRQRAILQRRYEGSRTWGASHEYLHHLSPDRLSEHQREALRSLIESTEPLSGLEREAYGFFLRRTRIDERGEPRALHESERATLSDSEADAIRRLVALYLRRQEAEIASLWARYPRLPVLVRAMRALEGGQLVPRLREERDRWLREDLATLRRTEGRLRDYLVWRDTEARRRREQLGTAQKLAQNFDRVRRQVDEELLRWCTACEVLAIPPPDDRGAHSWEPQAAWLPKGPACAHCGSPEALVTLSEAEPSGRIRRVGSEIETCPLPVPGWVARAEGFAPPSEPLAEEEAR